MWEGDGGERMSEKEASMNYKTIQRLGFVKGLYGDCYDNIYFAKGVRIPVEEYMGEEEGVRYRRLVNEVMWKLEELSDMLEVMDERMVERLDVWGEVREDECAPFQ